MPYSKSIVYTFSPVFPEKNRKAAALFLHGFPADSGKNEDIAKKISAIHSLESFILHYRGLGVGLSKFSFSNSISESSQFLFYLINCGYKNIYLIGHSWGSLIAVNLLAKYAKNISKAILLSPFLKFPNDREISKDLTSFIGIQKKMGKTYSLVKLKKDIHLVKKKYSINNIYLKISENAKKIVIIQGLHDTVCDESHIKNLTKVIKTGVKIIRVNDDHWLINRKNILNIVSNELE